MSTGAQIEITIQSNPIEIQRPSVGSHSGAIVEFTGIIRCLEKNKAINGINFESYEQMAKKNMKEILQFLYQENPFDRAVVVHRIDAIPVGEAAIYVRIESKHRAEGFEICSQFMDQLKKDVPIWKTGTF